MFLEIVKTIYAECELINAEMFIKPTIVTFFKSSYSQWIEKLLNVTPLLFQILPSFFSFISVSSWMYFLCF